MHFNHDYAYAWGGPTARANFRLSPDDFFVDEQLGFVPTGEGEHVLLHIEKRGQNTAWIAKQLARFADVRPMDVSYSGLKDRHAVTRQWFSVYLPGKRDLNWRDCHIAGTSYLAITRHHRKLRRGTHWANHFRIVVRQLAGDRDRLGEQLDDIAREGAPNYFGPQRFGRDDANLLRAQQYFAGERKAKNASQRGMLISAARSYLFNRVLSARVAEGSWRSPLAGDIFVLTRNRVSFYLGEDDSEAARALLGARIERGEISIGGPLLGDGAPQSSLAAHASQNEALVGTECFSQGLRRARVKQDWRALRVVPGELGWQMTGDDLCCEFTLPAGAFATTLLREGLALEDCSARA